MVYGVFEASGTSDPVPSMTTVSLDGPNNTTNDLIIGEQVIGTISGTRNKYINKKSDTEINFVYENNSRFENGEIINFVDSGVSLVIVR